MKKLIISAAIAATMTLSACANMQTSTAYDSTVKAATSTHAQATQLGNVWKSKKMKKAYVDAYLAKAAAAKKAGDMATANKYADKALKLAKAEVLQSKTYANMKPAWYK